MSIIWKVDPIHSAVQFKVKHLVISTVRGSFNQFDGTIVSEGEGFEGAKVTFSVDVSSIDTNMGDRDEHLRSPDFFDAEKYPELVFHSTSFEKNEIGDYLLTGHLSVKGVTEEVEFDVIFGGTAKDGYGNFKAGFEATTAISRKAFGLTWNDVTEAGSVVVADEVEILLSLQFIKQ
ncbi:YceI family protein [Olivibacter sp. SDN3]|uniref:YceI family protein n=1 Tax=Olivibacter sp. SDN3 TaxID=2764720 RepID=UPI001651AEC8|nr:YceI family protein [Olivibacter sp. SDN3]QNL50519.1 YceI family protein [Olivibacter sp. SDN3]